MLQSVSGFSMQPSAQDSLPQGSEHRRHISQSDLKVEMSQDDLLPGSGSNKFHRTSISRRIRRLVKGSNRRHLAIIGIFILFVVVLIQSYKHIPSYKSWSSSDIFACPSPRNNPDSISAPRAPDSKRMSKEWNSLHTLFNAHQPKPSSLPRTSFKTGSKDFPPIEILKEHLNISESDAHAARIEHEQVIRHIAPYPRGLFSGRGVIMLAGGHYSEFAAISLGMLREVGSKLPVEVWMKDDTEDKKGWCEELEKEGMACRKMSDHMDVSLLKHAYAWKVFTMFFSSFEEFIFLDADNMPLKNPDFVFDSDPYREFGVILWPDYWKNSGSPSLPYIIGVSEEPSDVFLSRDSKTVESGQVVWNKHRHWKSLCLAAYYNYYGPQYYYTLISQAWAGWGDKDTFPMALEALREDYFQVQHGIDTMFLAETINGIGMIQADPANIEERKALFLHANIVKWSVRDFLCVGCPADAFSRDGPSAVENPDDSVNHYLKDGKRIFDWKESGLDPEPIVWKAMEFTACRSVWGNHQLCTDTRKHMEKTFGFQFEASRIATAAGYGELVCVKDPKADSQS